MKYLLLIISISVFFGGATEYTLKGKIQGLSTGWIYLYHEQREKNEQDSVMAKDGQFVFKGNTDAPEFCLLAVKNKEGQKEWRTGFFLDKGEITISAKRDSMADAVIKGSSAQDEYIQFQESQKELEKASGKLDSLYTAAQAAKDSARLDSVMNAYKQTGARKQQSIKDYVAAHPTSYVAAYEVYANFSYDPDAALLQEIYTSLDPALQASFFGKKTKEVLNAALLTAIGKPAPDFTLNDANGKPVSLSSLKGQYVLVDFWASWCGPCRAENPAVLKAYNQYHSKGFTVMGVSLDEKKDKWIEAIKKDQLNWAQVSDLKGWKSSAADLYGIKGIPMNFLLDKDGKIIAKGLRGEDLEKKLAEVVQ